MLICKRFWNRLRKSHPTNILGKLHSVTLFASPIAGSFLAHFGIGAIADSLKPLSPQLQMLKRWTSCAYDREPWPEVKIVVGIGDQVFGHTASYLIDWTNDTTSSRKDRYPTCMNPTKSSIWSILIGTYPKETRDESEPSHGIYDVTGGAVQLLKTKFLQGFL
jgi:hypothetical protein